MTSDQDLILWELELEGWEQVTESEAGFPILEKDGDRIEVYPSGSIIYIN